MTHWVLFGGRFDPVHRGHLAVIDWWHRRHRTLRRVVVIPVGRPPHRPVETTTPFHHRYAMLALALRDRPWTVIWDDELYRPGASYTIDTLHRFADRTGARPDEIIFVMGADAFLSLHTWHRFPEHLNHCTFAVFHRPPHSFNAIRTYHHRYLPDVPLVNGHPDPWPKPPAVVWLPDLTVDIASTRIRDACRSGRPFHIWVPPSVAAYIQRYRLYTSFHSPGGSAA